MSIKHAVYRLSKAVGLFRLARRLTAGQLRILCYHGVALGDEWRMAPGLFMRPETFDARFDLIARGRYPVLSLSEALERLDRGELPACAVVITYDDGFYGNLAHGRETIGRFGWPMTYYVTTYYAVKETPIFRVLARYLFWKTSRTELTLDGLPGLEPGKLRLDGDPARVEEIKWRLIRHAEEHLDEPARVALSRELARRLGLDYDELAASRRFSLMTPAELSDLAAAGGDLQLHTHRHRLPVDREEVGREIQDNRDVLEPIAGRPLAHLCYPSGAFDRDQWPWLEALGVASATTTLPGFNDRDRPRMGLTRFLDQEDIAPIVFEAELSGFAELLRRARQRVRGRGEPTAVAAAQGH